MGVKIVGGDVGNIGLVDLVVRRPSLGERAQSGFWFGFVALLLPALDEAIGERTWGSDELCV
jgi:hypothetical protein